MNFREERELKRKKWRKIGWIAFGIVCIFGILIAIFCRFYPADSWKYYVHKPSVSTRKEGQLRMHFLDVGQGDCTIIEFPDGKTMIVDGGNGQEKTEKTVMRYINALKIKKFDYMVLTHADSDHCGTLDVVLKYVGAKTVYCPKINDYSVNPEYADFCITLEKSSATKVYTEVGLFQSFDGKFPYRFAFLSPHRTDSPVCEYNAVNDGIYTDRDMNDTSAVLLIEYQGKRALFCGDASVDVERSLLLSDRIGVWKTGELTDLHLKADILKVSHHGSSDSTGSEFLSYLDVKTAIISCGKYNAYGHPHAETLERLQKAGVEVFRTDKRGAVLLTMEKDGTYDVI